MEPKITKASLLKTIQVILNQSDFLPQKEIFEKAKKCNKATLQNLTIILYRALQQERNMEDKDKIDMAKAIIKFFGEKKRIFQKAQKEWISIQEQKTEASESLAEAKLLNEINQQD